MSIPNIPRIPARGSETESAAPAADLRGLHRTRIVVRNDALGEIARLDIKLSPVGLQLVMEIAAALSATTVGAETSERVA